MGRFHATTMYVSWVLIDKRPPNGRMKCGREPLDLDGVCQFDNIQLILHQALEGLESRLVKMCEEQQSKWHARYEREEGLNAKQPSSCCSRAPHRDGLQDGSRSDFARYRSGCRFRGGGEATNCKFLAVSHSIIIAHTRLRKAG
jgi:hypothetical protein